MLNSKVPVVENKLCIQCGKCLIACPHNAISRIQSNSCSKCMKYCTHYEVTCDNIHYVIDYEKCDSCGDCWAVCNDSAISWVEKDSLKEKIIENN